MSMMPMFLSCTGHVATVPWHLSSPNQSYFSANAMFICRRQVVAVGPGHLDEEGKRIPLPVSTGSSVLYSKYAGAEFKGADGTNYIVLRVSDLMAILS
jgi:hypothetical protein